MRMLPLKREVGPERPTSAILRGVYTGDDPKLRHKTAYISRSGDGWVVQVDELQNHYSHGWWKFPFEDWRPT